MTFIKTSLAVAIISVIAAAAAITHGQDRSGNQESQTQATRTQASQIRQWDIPFAAPFGDTEMSDLYLNY